MGTKKQGGLTLVSLVMILVLVAMALAGTRLYAKRELEQKQAAARAEIDASKSAFAEIRDRYMDAVKVASSTGRISLAGPVTSLQGIQREAAAVKTHSCLKPAKDLLAASIGLQVEAFLTFMRGTGVTAEMEARELIEQSSKKLGEHLSAVNASDLCAAHLSGKSDS